VRVDVRGHISEPELVCITAPGERDDRRSRENGSRSSMVAADRPKELPGYPHVD
jgi:hypothetical protein